MFHHDDWGLACTRNLTLSFGFSCFFVCFGRLQLFDFFFFLNIFNSFVVSLRRYDLLPDDSSKCLIRSHHHNHLYTDSLSVTFVEKLWICCFCNWILDFQWIIYIYFNLCSFSLRIFLFEFYLLKTRKRVNSHECSHQRSLGITFYIDWRLDWD